MDSYTKALLHADGLDGSTSFIDESGKVWTARGTAQIDTAQSVFGGASALFDGNSDWIDTPAHSDWDFDNGDFTLDFRIRFAALPGVSTYQTFVTQYVDVSNRWAFELYNNSGSYDFYLYVVEASVNTMNINATGATLAIDTWYHIALVRDGDDFDIYLDGTSIGSGNDVSDMPNLNAVLTFGARYFDRYVNGWMDEIRVSKGIARWTSNFTPPQSAYGSSSQVRPVI